MTPVAEEIKLKYQFSLLSNSIPSDLIDNKVIIDDGGGTIVDTEGNLDPDAREFDLDDEEEYF